jgi:hypothetical protein
MIRPPIADRAQLELPPDCYHQEPESINYPEQFLLLSNLKLAANE